MSKIIIIMEWKTCKENDNNNDDNLRMQKTSAKGIQD